MDSRHEVVIACSMVKEAEALEALLPSKFEVVATGLGIQRTVPSLLSRFRHALPGLLIFTGSASQLDLRLQMKDIVLPQSWCIEEGPPCFECDGPRLNRLRQAGFEVAARGLTLSQPVARAKHREDLHTRTGAVVFDRVTAAVLRVASTSGVPCLAPKIVANTTRSGLTGFWQSLDENLIPLARYLERMLAALES